MLRSMLGSATGVVAMLSLAACGEEVLPPQIASGQDAFMRQCDICHTVSASDYRETGPNLHNVYGRHVAGDEGFRYSDTLRAADFVWTDETLNAFLESPQTYLPGTEMAFYGVASAEERADLIAYLQHVAR